MTKKRANYAYNHLLYREGKKRHHHALSEYSLTFLTTCRAMKRHTKAE